MLPPGRSGRLERSCDRIRLATGAAGIERIAAHLHGEAHTPHRHDTYGIGITLKGVQRFRFRGVGRQCLPGQCHILHPDELHDGVAGGEAGFGYRIVHLDPVLVGRALDGRLPFVADPVLPAARLPPSLLAALWDFVGEPEPADLVASAADLLLLASGAAPAGGPPDLPALLKVREAIAAAPARRQSMADLERIAGLDRFTLARQFRLAFGTSPGRFRTMRQLDMVRRLLAGGAPLAHAALAAGFADQSHMTRHFRRAYGRSPGQWAASVRDATRRPPERDAAG